jgi:hypothetical protein
VELKNLNLTERHVPLVFHKEADPDGWEKHDWTDITDKCSPEIVNESLVIRIHQFGINEVMFAKKTDVPSRLCSLMNNKTALCKFCIYINLSSPSLKKTIKLYGSDLSQEERIVGYQFCGEGVSTVDIIDGEELFLSYDDDGNEQSSFHFQLDKCIHGAQKLLVQGRRERRSKCIRIHRRIPKQEICQVGKFCNMSYL